MAQVFISHSKANVAKARAVSAALGRAGFEVWWDDHLPTHRTYYEVIEERLLAASAVVVLWSKAAAASQWVRAEADHARTLNKLVQASVDGALPPMPFNQIQCAQLKGWRGQDQDAEWAKVVAGVEALAAAPAERAATPQKRRGRPWLPLAAVGVVALIALAALGYVVVNGSRAGISGAAKPLIAVLPMRAVAVDPDTKAFAAGLTDDVAGALAEVAIQTTPTPDTAAELAHGGQPDLLRLGAEYAFSGALRRDADRYSVRVYLQDLRRKVTIWSDEFEGPVDHPDALRKAVGNAVVEAATAMLETHKQPGLSLDPQAVALFIKGESTMNGRLDAANVGATRRAFEQVVALAPDFALGHSLLAESLAGALRRVSGSQAVEFKRQLRHEAETGIRIAPHGASPSYDALYRLTRIENPLDLATAEDIVLKGIAAEPDYPFLLSRECSILLSAGRTREAVGYCQRASSVRLSAAPISNLVAESLVATGDLVAARQAAAKSFERHPDDVARRSRLNLEVLRGEPAAALAILDSAEDRPQSMSPEAIAGLRGFLAARRSRNPAAETEAIARLSQLTGEGQLDVRYAVLGPAVLGRLDETFAALQNAPIGSSLDLGLLTDIALAPFRRDPRFWQEAARSGLITYWRKRGVWPDFCSAPAQPFDCKAAAARAQPI